MIGSTTDDDDDDADDGDNEEEDEVTRDDDGGAEDASTDTDDKDGVDGAGAAIKCTSKRASGSKAFEMTIECLSANNPPSSLWLSCDTQAWWLLHPCVRALDDNARRAPDNATVP